MKKNILLLVLNILLCFSVFSQKASVKGMVFDITNGKPLSYANVQIEGSKMGTVSDSLGMFIIDNIKPDFVILVASYVGYSEGISSQIKLSVVKQAYVEIGLMPISNKLKEINVKASLFRKVKESPLSVRRIGISDIENSAGGNRDISIVIQSFPGVRPSTSYRNDIIVRGGGPSENIFILDGVEIPVINHFSTQGSSGGPTGIMNVDFIDEVNLYTGAFPAKYSNVLSSVMDIKMSKANKEKITYNLSLGASESAFSFNGPLSKKSSFIFSLRRSYLQYLFQVLDLPFLPTFTDLQFKYDHKISDNINLSVFGISSLDKMRLNTDTKDLSDDRKAILDLLPENDQYSYSLGIVLKQILQNRTRSIKIGNSLLGNSANKYFNNDRSVEANKMLDFTSKEYRGSITLDDVIYIGDDKLNVGVSWNFSKIETENYYKKYVNNSVSTLTQDSRFRQNRYSLYSQYSGSLFSSRLEYSLGFNLESSDNNSQTKKIFEHISPRISFSYLLTDKLRLNFNTGKYYSLPNLLAYSYQKEGNYINKDLDYISCIHVVGGLEYNLNRNSRLTLEYFDKTYSNYPFSVDDGVSLANKGGGYGIVGNEALISESKGKARGFEFMARYYSDFKMSMLFSYTYVISEFTNDEKEYIPSSWDNRHLLTMTLGQKLKNNWIVGAKWRYVAGSPYTPYDKEKSSLVAAWNISGSAYIDYKRFNEKRNQNFHQLDLRIDKHYYYKGWSLGIYIDIQNVYNYKTANQNLLVRELNSDGNAIIINPIAAPLEQKYKMKEVKNETGTLLPTVGLMIEF